MLFGNSTRHVLSFFIAMSFGLGGCASESQWESDAHEGAVENVSSALPLAAVSMNGAMFAPLSADFASIETGAAVGTSTAAENVEASTNVGTSVGTAPTSFGSSFDTGPVGFSSSSGTGPIEFGSSFDTGPIEFGSSFDTGPIEFGNSFDTGPIEFNSGHSTSISSESGSPPVVQQTCVGFGCP